MKRANLPPLIAAVAITAVVSLAILSVVGHEAEAGNGTTHTVFVNNSVFCGDADSNCAQPYSIQINPGDTVQWPDGEAGTPHTVTQCSGDGTGCPGGTPGFDSGELTANPPTLYLTQSFPNEG
ncbi:MAG: hypothetical protein IH863_06990, partial [Chloroflexi bacterium]|nr:hypothetical protein [Chloroflexota bacterium]